MTTTATFDPSTLLTEFRTKFEASTDPVLWATLVTEETKELIDAMQDFTQPTITSFYGNVLKEAADLIYVMTGWADVAEEAFQAAKSPEEAAGIEESLPENVFLAATKALDTVGAIVGAEALQEAIEIVHASNLTKLGDDGKPVRREDGKIMKGPNYAAPDMAPLASKVLKAMR